MKIQVLQNNVVDALGGLAVVDQDGAMLDPARGGVGSFGQVGPGLLVGLVNVAAIIGHIENGASFPLDLS